MADAPGHSDHLKFQHFEVPLVDGKPLELGRGAMGVTYRATDSNLRVPVALKVISPALLADATARSRFLREARSAAALRHVNVATVVFLGEQEGQVFYAMEFVDGETVADFVTREKGMAAGLALEIAGQIAAALVAAEREGIVHRDLKPANIMLAKTDDADVLVKVIDFGLAKTVETPVDATLTLTQGGFLGTPLYASPEQLAEETVDTRSDIYSLGVTLFYMLIGRAPFVGSVAQVMSQHLSKDPPWAEIEDQPVAVLELLRGMLAKDPADRVQTAVDLRKRISECRSRLTPVGGASAATKSVPEVGEMLDDRYRMMAVETIGEELLRIEAVEERGGARVEIWMPVGMNPSGSGVASETQRQLASLGKAGVSGVRRAMEEGWTRGRWFVVLEAMPSTTLLDVVRATGSLGLAEFMPGLKQLAEAADRLVELDLPLVGFSLEAVRVAGDAVGDLRVDPVRVEGAGSAGTVGTISGESVLPPVGGAGAVWVIGVLAYEVLGGMRLSPGGKWVPVAELSEGANGVLRRAVSRDGTGGGFRSASEFAEALAAKREVSGSARRSTKSGTDVDRLRRESAPAGVSVPVEEGRRRWGGIAIASLVMVGLVGVAGWMLVGVGGDESIQTPKGNPEREVATDETVSATPTIAVRAEVPTAAERAVGADAEAFAAARELELADRYEEAMLAYAELADSPSRGAGAIAAIEQIATEMGGDFPEGLSSGELDRLRGALEIGAREGGGSSQQLLGASLRGIDDREALKWLEAASENGRSSAMVLAGLMLSNGAGVAEPDMERAAERFRQAGDLNNLNGWYYLAECYRDGLGVDRDPAKAAELARTAAADGDERAMALLGNLYRKGEGVPQDGEKAREFLRLAIKNGNLSAQSVLGVMVMNGEGGAAAPEEAFGLWREGAEAGDAACMFLYAQALTDPRFGRDPAAARDWYARAAAAGSRPAREWCTRNGVAIPERGE
ncbi:MAG: serine/threonine-protein kinase [Chthoniobacterales bacterium]